MPRTEHRKEGTRSQRSPRYPALSEKERIRGEIKPSDQLPRPSGGEGGREKGERGEKERAERERVTKGSISGTAAATFFRTLGTFAVSRSYVFLWTALFMARNLFCEIEGNGRRFTPAAVPSALAGVFDHPWPPLGPRSHRQVPLASTLKFQANAKMAGSEPAHVLPNFSAFSR